MLDPVLKGVIEGIINVMSSHRDSVVEETNEGFQKTVLWKLAQSMGCEDRKLGTLGLLKFIFGAKGRTDLIESVHFTLNELQTARGQGKAHGAWKTPDGSLIEDSKKKVENVLGALKELTAFLNTFDLKKQVENGSGDE